MADSTSIKPRIMSSDDRVLSRLNAVRLIVVGFIGLGYASTMAVGPQSKEWLNTFGYDPSLFGLQVLFFLSGWLAWRSLSRGRTVKAFILSRAKRTLPWLTLYTFIVAAILYPILCVPDGPTTKSAFQLSLYFLETVTLIDPGQRMPGALDEALYMCLLQGAVWSLRWGVIAFIGLLAAHLIGLRDRRWYLGLFVIAVTAHVGVNAWVDQTGSELMTPIIPGLRLAFPFLLGVSAYAWKDRLPHTSRGWAIISATALSITIVHYYGFRFSYAIEILAMTGWCTLAMALLHSRLSILKNWPNLVLPCFLGAWPAAQVWLVAIPDIPVPALVAITMSTSLGLAVLFTVLKGLIRVPVHRRVQPA